MTNAEYKLLVRTGYNLWHAVVTCSSPLHRLLFERMNHPRIGDFVIESTTLKDLESRSVFYIGAGTLVAIEHREVQWPKWTIKIPSGMNVMWENAHFFAVPGEHFDWYPKMPKEVS